MQEYDAKLAIYSEESFLTEKLETKFRDKYLEVSVFNKFSEVDLSNVDYLILNLLDKKISLHHRFLNYLYQHSIRLESSLNCLVSQ